MDASANPLIRPPRPGDGPYPASRETPLDRRPRRLFGGSRRRQWIVWLVVGFGALLSAFSNGCAPAGSTRSNRAADDPLPVDSGVGITSASPGRTPYGENSGTQSYPVGRAKQSLAPKPSPSPDPRLETL